MNPFLSSVPPCVVSASQLARGASVVWAQHAGMCCCCRLVLVTALDDCIMVLVVDLFLAGRGVVKEVSSTRKHSESIDNVISTCLHKVCHD